MTLPMMAFVSGASALYLLACLIIFFKNFPVIRRSVRMLDRHDFATYWHLVPSKESLDTVQAEECGAALKLGLCWGSSFYERTLSLLALPFSTGDLRRAETFLRESAALLGDEETDRLAELAGLAGLVPADLTPEGRQLLSASDFGEGILLRRLSPWTVAVIWHRLGDRYEDGKAVAGARAGNVVRRLPLSPEKNMARLESTLHEQGVSVVSFRNLTTNEYSLIAFAPFDPKEDSMVCMESRFEHAVKRAREGADFLFSGELCERDEAYDTYLKFESALRAAKAAKNAMGEDHETITDLAEVTLGREVGALLAAGGR